MPLTRRSFLATAAAGTAAAAGNALALDKWATDRDWTGNARVSYPEPAFEVMDKKFKGRQGNARLERLWTGALWLEGPVYMGALRHRRQRLVLVGLGRSADQRRAHPQPERRSAGHDSHAGGHLQRRVRRPKRNRLFMCGSTSIYAMDVNAVGAPMVPPREFV
jgi:hypothetical protein